MTVTPNFQPGFGPVRYKSTYGQNVADPDLPTPGSGASLSGGSVDFGNVEADMDYLYDYAVQLKIAVAHGFNLYGEANSAFTGSASLAASTRLYWLPTSFTKTSSGQQADANSTCCSSSTPFQVNSAPGDGANPPIYSSGSASATLSYDYILRTGITDPVGSYGLNVTYTVVAQ